MGNNGLHKKDKRLIGSYLDLRQRAIVGMIKDRTGKTVTDMMLDMIQSEGISAGILAEDGSVLPELEDALRLNMAFLRELDEHRKETRK